MIILNIYLLIVTGMLLIQTVVNQRKIKKIEARMLKLTNEQKMRIQEDFRRLHEELLASKAEF